ncbi:capsule biosynthesis protein [Undibacterium arcticum]|uniref:capsule biosynthesis protein n=1 Tax=Undibacterium arcticum TaxID=1762892 RepID=UPI003612ECAE
MHRVINSTSRVLLLQGPMGSFFSRFAAFIKAHRVSVWKVNFNGGDWLFSLGQNTLNYRGTLEAWPAYLLQVIQEKRIDRIFLFGDCRSYHWEAIKIARAAGIRVFVFEEGYVRPYYITLEENGVNGFSSLPRDPLFYLNEQATALVPKPKPESLSFKRMAWTAMAYYLAGALLRPYFWNYNHHKSFSMVHKGFSWCRSGVRKLLYSRKDHAFTQRLASDLSKHYFLAVLQVHNDAQVAFHSHYEDVRDFIREVIESFATHAPAESLLVLKHHPMDRGARHYGRLIDSLCARYNIADRIAYVHQIHLPTALDHARGVVAINSTVGLSALLHKAPVKVMGDAIYDMAGLTCQASLEKFWVAPGKVSKPLFDAFHRHVIATTQINGSFHGLEPFQLPARFSPSRQKVSSRTMQ